MTGAFTCRDESPPPDQEDGTELEHLGTGTATRVPSVCRKDSALCAMILHLAKVRSLLYATSDMVARGSR